METTSNMKLIPITARKRNETNSELSFPKYSSKPLLNRVRANKEKIPVLITGTSNEQTNIPGIKPLPLNNLKTHPETNPARPVFKTQHKTVKNGDIPKNKPLPGKTHTPLITPKSNPDHGPYKIAPIAIGIKAKLIDIPAIET